MSKAGQVPEQSDEGRVADATDANWVDRFAPRATRPYLRLSRADRPAGTWLLLIPCWWGLFLALWAQGAAPGWAAVWYFIAFALGAFLMRGAGCTWNDITDREYDAQVARTRSRPIPSGQVSVRGAAIWMVIQAALAFVILLSFNLFAVLLGIAALVPAIIYPFAKRFTWWPQVFLGLAFNWGALMGWAVVEARLSFAAVLLYLSGIAWTLFYDTIYACQDKEDDALIGVKSTARLFGDATKRWLALFAIATSVLMIGAAVLAHSGAVHPLSTIVVAAGIGGFAAHMIWQLRALDIDDAENCLKLFRANRDAGLIIVASLFCALLVNITLGHA